MPHLIHTPAPGQHVEFLIRDIHVPDPGRILDAMHGGKCLRGRVLQLARNAEDSHVFVVVSVRCLPGPCLVAAERILRVW